jgi:hypothetical protein
MSTSAEEAQQLATFDQIALSLSDNVSPTDDKEAPPPGFSPDDIQALEKEISTEGEAFRKSKEELEVEEVAWSSEDSLAAAQRFFASTAAGWGDEMGLWVAAAINSQVVDRFVAPQLNSTISGEYQRLKTRYDEEQAAFAERQKKAALAADIAGAVASPLTWVSAPASVTTRLAQLPGIGGSVTRTGAFLGRAATEGGIYGAGEAKDGERLQGAQEGATGGLLGASIGKVLTKGLGAVTDLFTRRRIEGNLIDDDGDFVPITLAAAQTGVEGLIRTLYRDVIAPSFGAKGVIKEQEDVIIIKTENMLKELGLWTKQLDEGVVLKEKEISEQLTKAEGVFKEEGEALKIIKKRENDIQVAPLDEKLKALNSGKAEELVNRGLAYMRQVSDSLRFDFRNTAFLSSLPAGANSQDIKKILEITDIGSRAKALDTLWKNKGYSMIKNNKFIFKPGELQEQIETALKDDVYFLANAMDMKAVMRIVDQAIESVDLFKDPSGIISGEIISALRSRIGTVANATVDVQQQRAIYAVQDQLDTIIRKQLTKEQKEAFAKESGQWKSTVILRETIEKAFADPKKRGAFDETDWISVTGKNNRWDSRYGTGPLIKRARELESSLSAATKKVAKRATRLAKAKAGAIEKTMQSHHQKLKNALDVIEKDIKLKKSKLSANPQLATEIANDMTKRNSLGVETEQLDKTLKTLKVLRSPSSPGWFHTIAATTVLSAGFKALGLSFQDSVTAAGAVVVGGGRALATPTAQKLIAGQTSGQEAVQRMLNSDATGRTSEILNRLSGPLGSRGMLTEEKQGGR